jgi:beta-xylosidase
MLTTKFAFYAPRADYLNRFRLSAGTLSLAGQGSDPAQSSPLLFVAGDRAYEVTIELEIEPGAEGGLLLFYNEKLYCGLGLSDGQLHAYRIGQQERWPPGGPASARRMHIRVVNDANVATFYHSTDGTRWTKERSFEVAGYNHNVADGFLSLRPGIYAAGEGGVKFQALSYRAVEPGSTDA